jgi:hypothetical protein
VGLPGGLLAGLQVIEGHEQSPVDLRVMDNLPYSLWFGPVRVLDDKVDDGLDYLGYVGVWVSYFILCSYGWLGLRPH